MGAVAVITHPSSLTSEMLVAAPLGGWVFLLATEITEDTEKIKSGAAEKLKTSVLSVFSVAKSVF